MGLFSSIRRVVANVVLLPVSIGTDIVMTPIKAIKGENISLTGQDAPETFKTVQRLGSALVDTKESLQYAAEKDI